MEKKSKLHLTDLTLSKDEITFLMKGADGVQEQMDVKFIDSSSSEFFYKMLSWALKDDSLFNNAENNSMQHDVIELPNDGIGGKAFQLCKQYIAMVASNVNEERDVQVYASKLGITPNYLSVVIKRFTGFTPSEIIASYTVSNAKQLLARTNMDCKQISQALNFPNQSFFGKYFKKQTGLTPGAFRKKGRQIL